MIIIFSTRGIRAKNGYFPIEEQLSAPGLVTSNRHARRCPEFLRSDEEEDRGRIGRIRGLAKGKGGKFLFLRPRSGFLAVAVRRRSDVESVK